MRTEPPQGGLCGIAAHPVGPPRLLQLALCDLTRRAGTTTSQVQARPNYVKCGRCSHTTAAFVTVLRHKKTFKIRATMLRRGCVIAFKCVDAGVFRILIDGCCRRRIVTGLHHGVYYIPARAR